MILQFRQSTDPPEASRTYSSVWANDAPGYRHGRSMLDSSQAWSAKNPELKVQGFAAVLQSPLLKDVANYPIWPRDINLVGYTRRNHQIRMAWFPHAYL